MIKALTPIIDRQRDQIAKLITYETGKPIVESQLEITYAIR
jgi:acyl-CoA reductase-like NAD-dependent aldehyde dehydrogenase